jgi:outer membrane protein
MKTSLALALLALSTSLLVRADDSLPTGPLTLSQTVNAVLARYPSLDAAQAEIDSAKAQTEQSNAERLPQVSAGGNYNYQSYRPGIAFGGTIFYTTSEDSYNANVTLSQLLTDFGRTDAIVAAARAGELSAKDALEDTRHQLGYEAIQDFYGVLLLRQSVSVADEEITSLNEALRIAQKKFDAGSATKFDVLTTQVRLANSQNHRTDLIGSLE